MRDSVYELSIAKYPNGVPLSVLSENLSHVPDHFKDIPHLVIENFWQKLALREGAIRTAWCNEKSDNEPFQTAFDWKVSGRLLHERCFDAFTFEDKVKLYWGEGRYGVRFGGKFHPSAMDDAAYDPQYAVLGKIVNSFWRWGSVSRRFIGPDGTIDTKGSANDWNEFVDAYDGIRRFDFGVPGFTVTLNMTTSYNEKGYAEFGRVYDPVDPSKNYALYLDGTFGFMVHYKGQHVLTIGFSFFRNRTVLLQQVQMRNKKGNRWLFKLPVNVVEHAINRIREAFKGFEVVIGCGKHIANEIKASYGKNPPPAPEVLNRIAAFYSVPLTGYRRRGWVRSNWMRFYRLRAREMA